MDIRPPAADDVVQQVLKAVATGLKKSAGGSNEQFRALRYRPPGLRPETSGSQERSLDPVKDAIREQYYREMEAELEKKPNPEAEKESKPEPPELDQDP